MAENHALISQVTANVLQQDAMKDVKDTFKKLMGGDFERQFKDDEVEKCDKKRHMCLVALAVIVGVLATCLLGLTVMREVQITQLRQEVDELTVNMIAMSASVKSLNQKINNNKLFNEFKALEDTIYADEDQDITNLAEEGKDEKDKSNYDLMEKLNDLTVLEDDNLGDDEDMLDAVDDAESGDWYPDYDRRMEKIGTTNMVRLKAEDFTNSVLTFEKNGEKSDLSNIREIRRLLNEDPENPRLPALAKIPVKTDTSKDRDKRSVFPDAPSEFVDPYAAPRVITKTDERRKTKKYTPNNDSTTPSKVTMHTVTRTIRNSDNEDDTQRRPFIAAHFHGNTSHLSTEIHDHYKGNGLVRVAHGSPHDVWYPAPWTIASPHPRPTLTRNGHVHVHHTGVYLVYVQIYYLDSHDVISWVLHRTNPEIEGRETLLQCAQSTHSVEPFDKPNSCFSAAALFLKAGDRLAVRNTGGDRHSLMQPEKSFIGLVKLADAEDPTQEL